MFIGATFVKSKPIAQFPKKVYAFQSIKEIIGGNFYLDFLIGMTYMFTIFISMKSYSIIFLISLCFVCVILRLISMSTPDLQRKMIEVIFFLYIAYTSLLSLNVFLLFIVYRQVKMIQSAFLMI